MQPADTPESTPRASGSPSPSSPSRLDVPWSAVALVILTVAAVLVAVLIA